MKKRKSPILLLSVLFILVGVMVVFAMSQGGGDKPGDAPKADDTAELGNGRPAVDPKEMEKIARTTTANGAKAAVPVAKQGPKPGLPAETSDGPSIALKTQAHVFPKQKPNPNNSTDSQWYAH